MFDRITRIIMVIILTLAVMLGAMLAFKRHQVESAGKTVELSMDLRDLKMLSALSKYPMDKLLNEVKARGLSSVGLPEETLPEASAMGELYYASGSGILRFVNLNPQLSALAKRKLIRPDKTYIFCINPTVRKRVTVQLQLALTKKAVKNLGNNVLEVSEAEYRLRDVGLGLSEATVKYLKKKGFSVIPRLLNDPRYEIIRKIETFKDLPVIIFDGDEILGYPGGIPRLAYALLKTGIKYGNIEIIKQDGDQRLKALMGGQIIRVHSVPRDELLKISKAEAVDRFARAVKERSIRLIYIRPFLPPQITEDPVTYNLAYLSDIAERISGAGYILGRASTLTDLRPQGWQIIVLGLGVIIMTLFLADSFITIPYYIIWGALLLSLAGMVFLGAASRGYPLEKGLALLAAISFPAYAVISQFKKSPVPGTRPLISAYNIFINVLADCALGILIIVGLLSNSLFMLTSQTFVGVKIALVFPILLVMAYFFFKLEGSIKEKIKLILNYRAPLLYILGGVVLLAGLMLFIARSSNFVIPVPALEKSLRAALEQVLLVRPRTKEFLIGYPVLILAAYLLQKNRREWLWLLLAIGVIGPISLLNTFTHIHTPLIISIIRSVIGIVLGAVLGLLLILIADRIERKSRI